MTSKISARTELCLAAFHYAHGSAGTLDRDRQRLHVAVDAVKVAELTGKHDRQLLQACMRALICEPRQVEASRAGVDEILTLACQDKDAAGADAAALQLGLQAGPEFSWQQRADLR